MISVTRLGDTVRPASAYDAVMLPADIKLYSQALAVVRELKDRLDGVYSSLIGYQLVMSNDRNGLDMVNNTITFPGEMQKFQAAVKTLVNQPFPSSGMTVFAAQQAVNSWIAAGEQRLAAMSAAALKNQGAIQAVSTAKADAQNYVEQGYTQTVVNQMMAQQQAADDAAAVSAARAKRNWIIFGSVVGGAALLGVAGFAMSRRRRRR